MSNEPSWYLLTAMPGHEEKGQEAMVRRARSLGFEDSILDVRIPVQEEESFSGGKRRVVKRKLFPGYILIQMRMSPGAWDAVVRTPGIRALTPGPPVPLAQAEVERMLASASVTAGPRLEVGQKVRIVEGPLSGFEGSVLEAGEKVRVAVEMMGRTNEVELDPGWIRTAEQA